MKQFKAIGMLGVGLLLAVAFVLSLAPTRSALAVVSGAFNSTLVGMTYPNDPCQNPTVIKSSFAVAVGSATTTLLVNGVAGKVTYPCSFSATLAGTTPTAKLEYGTGSSCGTGTTALTGVLAPTAGTFVQILAPGAIAKIPAANELCLVSGGTPSIQGVLTYAIQ